MFRPSRLIQTYSLHLPRRTLAARQARCFSWKPASRQIQHESVTVQSVRLRRQWSGRRVLSYCLYTATAYACVVYAWAALEVLLESEDDEEYENGDSAEGVTDEADDKQTLGAQQSRSSADDTGGEVETVEVDLIAFLPLTPAQRQPRVFYKGTDPEWKAFQKYSHPKELEKLFKRLALVINQGLTQLPTTKTLGANARVQKYWLDAVFPAGPPPVYVRTGLALTDTYLAVGQEVVTQEHYQRYARILWPVDTLRSIYQFVQVLFVFQKRRIKDALGLDTTLEPGSTEYKMHHMVKAIRAHEAALAAKQGQRADAGPNADDGDPAGMPVRSLPSPRALLSAFGLFSTKEDDAAEGSQNEQGQRNATWNISFPTITLPVDPAETTLAMLVFSGSMREKRQAMLKEPPRGNFGISGLLQAAGNRAMITFDVSAYFDPATDQFTHINVIPRSIRPREQIPRA